MDSIEDLAASRPDDDAIRALVVRLSRSHPSGGEVIERAAILAAGADFDAVIGWIVAHDGRAEQAAAPAAKGGLHGAQDAPGRAPLRYVLPAGALAP